MSQSTKNTVSLAIFTGSVMWQISQTTPSSPSLLSRKQVGSIAQHCGQLGPVTSLVSGSLSDLDLALLSDSRAGLPSGAEHSCGTSSSLSELSKRNLWRVLGLAFFMHLRPSAICFFWLPFIFFFLPLLLSSLLSPFSFVLSQPFPFVAILKLLSSFCPLV